MMPVAEKPKAARMPDNSWHAVRLIIPFFRQYRLQLAIGFLSLLAVNGLQLIIPRIVKHAVDGLQNEKLTPDSLLQYGFMIFGLAVGIAVFRFGWRLMLLGFSRHLEKDLRNWIFSHLLTLDRVFFQRSTAGEIMALATILQLFNLRVEWVSLLFPMRLFSRLPLFPLWHISILV